MDRVSDRRSSIDLRSEADPRCADVADRLVGFGVTDHAVRIKRGEDRNERSSRGGRNGNDLCHVLDPLCSFFRRSEELFH